MYYVWVLLNKQLSHMFVKKSFNASHCSRILSTTATSDSQRVWEGWSILCGFNLRNSWNSANWHYLLELHLKNPYISRAKSSHLLGSSLQAWDAHKWTEWHTHFIIIILGQDSLRRLVTELFSPIITLHPSAANPIKLVSGTLSFSNDFISELNKFLPVAPPS